MSDHKLEDVPSYSHLRTCPFLPPIATLRLDDMDASRTSKSLLSGPPRIHNPFPNALRGRPRALPGQGSAARAAHAAGVVGRGAARAGAGEAPGPRPRFGLGWWVFGVGHGFRVGVCEDGEKEERSL